MMWYLTKKEKRRVDLVVGVSYRDDIGKVNRLIAEVLNGGERILKDPAPKVAVPGGESGVNFAVRPRVHSANYRDVYFDTTENLKKRFDAEWIHIPFPQQDVNSYRA